MAFFPEIENITVSTKKEIGKDFIFENGQHILNADGTLKECNERENIENWIRKVVSTQVGAYEVYVRDEKESFGTNIYDNLGTKNRGYWLSEIKREITEQLLKSEFIDEVKNFRINTERRKIIIEFDVVTNGIVISEVVEV